jgi:hypothetical protein
MRFLTPRAYALATVVCLGITGCAGHESSQFAPSVQNAKVSPGQHPSKMMQRFMNNGLISMVPLDIQRDPHPAWMRLRNTRPNDSSDIAWVSGFEFPSLIGRFSLPNKNNAPPSCQTPGVDAVNYIGTDSKGNLWVPAGNNGPLTGTVQEYNCNGSYGTVISVPYGQPSDVAVDLNGDVIVGDIADYTPFQGGYYYTSGTANIYTSSGSFIGKLSDPSFFPPHPPGFDNFSRLAGVAVDANNNCYVSHYDRTGAGEVVEFAGCKPADKGKILAGPHPWEPGKPTFDSAGNLIITDITFDQGYRVMYGSVYKPPYDAPAFKTFKTWGLSGSCPLDSAQKNLYCASQFAGSVDVYSYPAGKYQYSFNNGLQQTGATGIAIAPSGSK